MKILLFDIENAPLVTWSWGIHEDPSHSTKFVKDDWYIMCWSAKWLDDKNVITCALPDFEYNYKKPCDKEILKKLWNLLDEADVVIAHNGFKFDRRKANARFLIHGMTPPSPYKMIDTLRVARSNFMFTSNKLGDLGNYLGVGSKVDTGGFDLWIDCMAGKKRAWDKMVRYCKNDVILLEKVYKKLRPYISNHPNMSMALNGFKCKHCGSTRFKVARTRTQSFGLSKHILCYDCGKYTAIRIVDNGFDSRKNSRKNNCKEELNGICTKCGAMNLRKKKTIYNASGISYEYFCMNCKGYCTKKIRGYTKEERANILKNA